MWQPTGNYKKPRVNTNLTNPGSSQDYVVTDTELNISVCQLKGGRSYQEDRIAIAATEQFASLTEQQKKNALTATLAILQYQDADAQKSAKSDSGMISGSTLNAVFVGSKDICTLNLGDSSAYLIEYDPATQRVSLQRLNATVHQVDPSINFQEYDRLRRHAETMAGPPPKQNKNNGGWYLAKTQNAEVACSRGLGDHDAEQSGLSHEADIDIKKLTVSASAGKKRFVIVASDGLTEGMPQQTTTQAQQLEQVVQRIFTANPAVSAEQLAADLTYYARWGYDSTQTLAELLVTHSIQQLQAYPEIGEGALIRNVDNYLKMIGTTQAITNEQLQALMSVFLLQIRAIGFINPASKTQLIATVAAKITEQQLGGITPPTEKLKFSASTDNITVMVATIDNQGKALMLADGHSGAGTAQRLADNFFTVLVTMVACQRSPQQFIKTITEWPTQQLAECAKIIPTSAFIDALDSSFSTWLKRGFGFGGNSLRKKLDQMTGAELTKLILAHPDPKLLQKILPQGNRRWQLYYRSKLTQADYVALAKANHPDINAYLRTDTIAQTQINAAINQLKSDITANQTRKAVLPLLVSLLQLGQNSELTNGLSAGDLLLQVLLANENEIVGRTLGLDLVKLLLERSPWALNAIKERVGTDEVQAKSLIKFLLAKTATVTTDVALLDQFIMIERATFSPWLLTVLQDNINDQILRSKILTYFTGSNLFAQQASADNFKTFFNALAQPDQFVLAVNLAKHLKNLNSELFNIAAYFTSQEFLTTVAATETASEFFISISQIVLIDARYADQLLRLDFTNEVFANSKFIVTLVDIILAAEYASIKTFIEKNQDNAVLLTTLKAELNKKCLQPTPILRENLKLTLSVVEPGEDKLIQQTRLQASIALINQVTQAASYAMPVGDKILPLVTDVEINLAKTGKVDYQAYNPKLKIGYYEAKGNNTTRQQEDRIVIAEINSFAELPNQQVKEEILRETVALLQYEYEQMTDANALRSGSTLSAVMVDQTTIYTASLGDSTAYLVTINDEDPQNISVSLERLNPHLHNYDSEVNNEEYQRARQAAVRQGQPASHRSGQQRLSSGLAVTRALGDCEHEKAGLSHQPEISVRTVAAEHKDKQLIINACDGLTEAMTEVQLKAVITEIIKANRNISMDDLAKRLVAVALEGKPGQFECSNDNISVLATGLDANNKAMVVADGHGGDQTSQLISVHFFPILQELMPLKQKDPDYTQLNNWPNAKFIAWAIAAPTATVQKIMTDPQYDQLPEKFRDCSGKKLVEFMLAHAGLLKSDAIISWFDHVSELTDEDLLTLIAANQPDINKFILKNDALKDKTFNKLWALWLSINQYQEMQVLPSQDALTHVLNFYQNQDLYQAMEDINLRGDAQCIKSLVMLLANTSKENAENLARLIEYPLCSVPLIKTFLLDQLNAEDLKQLLAALISNEQLAVRHVQENLAALFNAQESVQLFEQQVFTNLGAIIKEKLSTFDWNNQNREQEKAKIAFAKKLVLWLVLTGGQKNKDEQLQQLGLDQAKLNTILTFALTNGLADPYFSDKIMHEWIKKKPYGLLALDLEPMLKDLDYLIKNKPTNVLRLGLSYAEAIQQASPPDLKQFIQACEQKDQLPQLRQLLEKALLELESNNAESIKSFIEKIDKSISAKKGIRADSRQEKLIAESMAQHGMFKDQEPVAERVPPVAGTEEISAHRTLSHGED